MSSQQPPLEGSGLFLFDCATAESKRLSRETVDLVSLGVAALRQGEKEWFGLAEHVGESVADNLVGLARALPIIGNEEAVRNVLRARDEDGADMWAHLSTADRESLVESVSRFGADRESNPSEGSRSDVKRIGENRGAGKKAKAVLTEDAPEPVPFDPERVRCDLAAKVKGQPEAIEVVVARLALTKRRLALSAERPDGVFLFVGPTGVGKTELARAVNSALNGGAGDDGLIRIDMSEHRQEHTVSLLIGAPPGYTGCDKPERWLTTRLGKCPNSVVLLDEIEKAHPSVLNIFLQAFDAGHMTDSQGNRVDCSSAVFVMTSNIGAHELARPSVGFAAGSEQGERDAELKRAFDAAVREALLPELVNRIDAIVPFRSLAPEDIAEIAAVEVARAVETARASGWDLEVTDAARRQLVELGYDRSYGVRHLKRTIEETLMQPLALADLQSGHAVADVVEGVIKVVALNCESTMKADG